MATANNNDELEGAAQRLESDPFFMASVLAKYRSEMHLNEQQLARGLSCSLEALTKLALCRAPRVADPQSLLSDVKAISEYVACDPNELVKIVRTVQSFRNLQQFGAIADSQLLKAARDKQRKRVIKRSKASKRKR